MFAERQLCAGSASAKAALLGGCSHLRLTCPGQHMHAARSGLGKRPGFGIAAAAPRTPSAVASSTSTRVIDQEVDAIAVVEPPGAVYSTQFEQHDQALQQLKELEAFNEELSSAIVDADVVLLQTTWNSLTLPVSGVVHGGQCCCAAAAPNGLSDMLLEGAGPQTITKSKGCLDQPQTLQAMLVELFLFCSMLVAAKHPAPHYLTRCVHVCFAGGRATGMGPPSQGQTQGR